MHADQPETFYRIFNRVLSNRDVATGTRSADNYRSRGPASSFGIKEVLPQGKPIECNTWQVGTSCTPNQQTALADGNAVVQNYIVVDPAS